eukprot:s2103_g3.t1
MASGGQGVPFKKALTAWLGHDRVTFMCGSPNFQEPPAGPFLLKIPDQCRTRPVTKNTPTGILWFPPTRRGATDSQSSRPTVYKGFTG